MMPSTVSTEVRLATPTNEGAELAALLQGAGVAPLEDMGWIRVTGPDRVRWLNGMVTNSIQHLTPGEAAYCFVLNAQGRIQGDLTAFALPGSLLLETGQPGRLATALDHFIIMDDVELTVAGRSGVEAEQPEDVRPGPVERIGLTLAGPGAPAMLLSQGLSAGSELSMTAASWQSHTVDVIHAYSPLVPRYEVWGTPAAIDPLAEAFVRSGATPVSPAALESLRMLEGTPRYGVDIRDRDLPQETGQTRALHFNKGCYLGQEIVERIRSRGQVHRMFAGFALTGELPPPGSALEAEGKAVGELTSVAAIEHPVAGRIQLALGYVRREAVERAAQLTYAGGTAAPVPLPYTRA